MIKETTGIMAPGDIFVRLVQNGREQRGGEKVEKEILHTYMKSVFLKERTREEQVPSNLSVKSKIRKSK